MADREQIDKMAQAMCGFCAVDKLCVLKCCAPCSDVASQDCSYKENAEMLISAGYGDVSEYKAEIERLRQEVRDTDKMARNSIEQYKNNYDKAFERLKAQERETERLKDEIFYLERKIAIRDNALKDSDKAIEMLEGKQDTIVKQAKIDVLKELKKRARTSYVLDDFILGSVVFSKDIDEIIEEVQNGEDKS